MTYRQRVINALNHKPVDRVPIDLGSHMSTGISMFSYWNLREYLGLSTDKIWIPDIVQGLAYVDDDILERFHCDIKLLEPCYNSTINWNPRGTYNFSIAENANPIKNEHGEWIVTKGKKSMRMQKDGYYFDGDWLNDFGLGSEDERIELYALEAERIYKETNYATILVGYSHGLGLSGFGTGEIDDAILAYDDPKALYRKRKKTLSENLRIMRKVIDRFGSYIQLISFSDDMGTQSGLMCSPAYMEEFCFPYYKRLCDFIHENSDIKVFLHNCGSIKEVIPSLIGAGIDVLNPVQISAKNMNPVELKKKFGNELCFWGGGCNTQVILGDKSTAAVSENIRMLMNIFKNNSGFVFNQVHNILGNVPPENIIAMLDTAYEESFINN